MLKLNMRGASWNGKLASCQWLDSTPVGGGPSRRRMAQVPRSSPNRDEEPFDEMPLRMSLDSTSERSVAGIVRNFKAVAPPRATRRVARTARVAVVPR